jgi:single-strand DNA-binding protein
MNNVILRGRLTAAPDVRITTDEKNTTTARFSLAVQDKSHKNHNGDYDVDFVKCVAFNGIANNLHQYCDKGSEILITGRLHCYSYKNKEDKNVYMTEVIVEKVEFVSNCQKADVEIPDIPDEELPFK